MNKQALTTKFGIDSEYYRAYNNTSMAMMLWKEAKDAIKKLDIDRLKVLEHKYNQDLIQFSRGL